MDTASFAVCEEMAVEREYLMEKMLVKQDCGSCGRVSVSVMRGLSV